MDFYCNKYKKCHHLFCAIEEKEEASSGPLYAGSMSVGHSTDVKWVIKQVIILVSVAKTNVTLSVMKRSKDR